MAETHSLNFARIRVWYRAGVCVDAQLRQFVAKGQITEAEYLEIVGENK